MASPLILVTASILLATAVLFALVAALSGRRTYSRENRIAGIAFTLGWAALATKALFDAGRMLIPFLGGQETVLWLTFTRFVIVATALSIWGFGYYVGFLWSGRARFNLPLAFFAGSHALDFLYFIEATQQLSVVAGTWGVRIQETSPGLPPLAGAVILVYFFVPILLIAAAYLILSFRLPHRLQRLRAASIALAVITYMAGGIYLSAPQADPNSILNPIAATTILIASTLAYALYRNPAWLQRRIGPIKETTPSRT